MEAFYVTIISVEENKHLTFLILGNMTEITFSVFAIC